MMFVLLALFLLFGVSSVLSSLWLTRWTEDSVLQNATLANTSIYVQHRDLYLGVYGGFGVMQGTVIYAVCLMIVFVSVCLAWFAVSLLAVV